MHTHLLRASIVLVGVALLAGMPSQHAWAADVSAKTHRFAVEWLKDRGAGMEVLQVSFFDKIDPSKAAKLVRKSLELSTEVATPAGDVFASGFDDDGDLIAATEFIYVAKKKIVVPYAEYKKTLPAPKP